MKVLKTSSALCIITVFLPVLCLADITINASQNNSNSGITSSIEITGGLDTSTLTIKDIAPLADTERGSGIGVGLYPSSSLSVGGIYTTPDFAYVISYFGIGSADSQLLTSSANPVPASVATATEGNTGFGIDNQFIYLPSSYVSGSPLDINLTFSGKSLADLGLSAGTRTWTVGNNQVTINVSGLVVPPALAVSQTVPGSSVVGQPVQLSMTGGYSGGAISYSAIAFPSGSSGLTCSINGNVLTATGGPGICRIIANQAANSSYTASNTLFNIAVSITPAPNPIPTLAAWSQLAMMSLLVAGVGLFGRRLNGRQ